MEEPLPQIPLGNGEFAQDVITFSTSQGAGIRLGAALLGETNDLEDGDSPAFTTEMGVPAKFGLRIHVSSSSSWTI